MTNIPLDTFDFDRYNYEVAFEFRDPTFVGRLLGSKKERLVYYIRRCEKNTERSDGELVLSQRRDDYTSKLRHDFKPRENECWGWRVLYWDNPNEPQEFLTRVYMKLKPSQDNVTFTTASLGSNP